MRLREFAGHLNQEVPFDVPLEHFTFDSREVKKGSVFFALKGQKFDGHDFLAEIAAKGAVCAVVSKEYVGFFASLILLRVDDVRKSLQNLAQIKFRSMAPICVGVTGSVGKTTTKEFIATLLEKDFCVAKTPASCNSQVGLPLSILNLQVKPEIFVAEMGMSQMGEMSRLVQIAPPNYAVVTKIGMAHSEFFPGGISEIAQAKAEILSHPATKKAFLHAQTRQFKPFQNTEISTHFYSLAKDPYASSSQTKLEITPKGFLLQGHTFTLPFQARHLVENFLGAALVANELGLSFERIIQRAQDLVLYTGRFEFQKVDGALYINDAYNANPESVKAALENLPKPQKGKKAIAILGEMLELGAFSKNAHQEMGQVARDSVDLLLCLSGDSRYMLEAFEGSEKKAEYFDDLKKLKKACESYIEPGDVVLVKGSNSLKLWKLLEKCD